MFRDQKIALVTFFHAGCAVLAILNELFQQIKVMHAMMTHDLRHKILKY